MRAPFYVRVGSERGAPMGRPNGYLSARNGPVRLEKVPIDSGGYDPGGAYWGAGRDPVWCAYQGESAIWFRSPNREAAKLELRAASPELTFYR